MLCPASSELISSLLVVAAFENLNLIPAPVLPSPATSSATPTAAAGAVVPMPTLFSLTSK